MKAEELDDRFDRGEEVSAQLDLAEAQRPGSEARQVDAARGCQCDGLASVS